MPIPMLMTMLVLLLPMLSMLSILNANGNSNAITKPLLMQCQWIANANVKYEAKADAIANSNAYS